MDKEGKTALMHSIQGGDVKTLLEKDVVWNCIKNNFSCVTTFVTFYLFYTKTNCNMSWKYLIYF